MSQAAEIILLAEDVRQRKIIQRYLTKKRGYSHHCIRVIVPNTLKGETAGLTFIRTQFPDQVEALRTYLKKRSTILIVVADADNETVEDRVQDLDKRLIDAQKPARKSGEPILFVIPRRNVETWMHFLEGNAVDESTDYKSRCSNANNGEFARKFADFAYPIQNWPADCPDSLRRTCQTELPRIP